MVADWAAASGGRIICIDGIDLIHLGLLPEVQQAKNKVERNLALLARQMRWRNVGVSVLSGDQRSVTLHLQQRTLNRRGRLPMRWPGSRLVLVRDLLGLRRDRTRTTTSCLAAACAVVLLVALEAPNSAAAVAAALVLFAVTGRWTTGLAAHVDNAGGSGLTPHSPARMLLWHLQAPGLLAAAVVVAGGAVAVAFGAAPTSIVSGAAIALVTLSVRVWVLTQPLLPPALLTPQPTPAGDLSGLVVAAWFARGWLVVAGTAFVAANATGSSGDLGDPLLVSLITTAVVSLLTARRVRSWR